MQTATQTRATPDTCRQPDGPLKHVRPGHAILVLSLLGAAVYANSTSGPFVFDDLPRIVDNPDIRSLWPLPSGRRPIGDITFALNYQLAGLAVAGYHLVNAAIHILNGCLLFGIVRRVLELRRAAADWHTSPSLLAFGIAAIWLVHPLQTESVTYVVQRYESLMGFFYLACLYCVIRSSQSSRVWAWQFAAVFSFSLGVGTKESMITAIAVVLLFDRIFLADSWAHIVRNRAMVYLGCLPATGWMAWLLRGAFLPLLGETAASSRTSLGFGVETVSGWDYLTNQASVILHYLGLVFWPRTLCLDYMWRPASTAGELAVPIALILMLLAASLLLLRLRPKLGFLCVAFFVLLAPTSSFVPIIDLAFEHRMYLPLAPVVALVVVGMSWWLSRLLRTRVATDVAMLGLCVAVLIPLSLRTWARNVDYRDAVRIWADVLATAPHNYRAHLNLATLLSERGQTGAAMRHYRRAIGLQPAATAGHNLLGELLLQEGDAAAAADVFQSGLEGQPDSTVLRHNLATTLVLLGRLSEAREQCEQVLAVDPAHPLALNQLGLIHLDARRLSAAVELFERAVKAEPANPDFRFNLAVALEAAGDRQRALHAYERTLEIQGTHAGARNNLASLLFQLGDYARAREHFAERVRSAPGDAVAHFNLGLVLSRIGGHADAARHFQESLHIDPTSLTVQMHLARTLTQLERNDDALQLYRKLLAAAPQRPELHTQLGILLASMDRAEEAEQHFRSAIQLEPENGRLHSNLAQLLLAAGRLEEAESHFKIALELVPDLPKAREGLRRTAQRRSIPSSTNSRGTPR